MAARRRKNTDGDKPLTIIVRKRPRRPGPKRSVQLRLCAQHAERLDVAAAKGLTTPAEVVMDALEVHFGWRRSTGPIDVGDAGPAEGG